MSLLDLMLHRTSAERLTPQSVGATIVPPASVRVLRTEDELHSAVSQAVEFERRIAAQTSARVSHYEELIGSRKLVPLRPVESLTEADREANPTRRLPSVGHVQRRAQ